MELLKVREISWLLPSRENAIIQTFPSDHEIFFEVVRASFREFHSVEQLNDNWLCFINNLLFFSISHRVPRNEEWRKNLLYQNSFALALSLNKFSPTAQHFQSLRSLFSIISTCGFKTNLHTYDGAYKMQIYCGWFIVRRPNKKW